MHHFIYPSKDTYITNRTGLEDKNFGIDEILQIGTKNIPQRILNATKEYSYIDTIFTNQGFLDFTGVFTGSLAGSSSFANGTISGSNIELSASYFSGSIDGNVLELSASAVSGSLVDGYITGSIIIASSVGLFTGQLTGSKVCLTGTGSGIEVTNEQNWTTSDTKFVDRTLIAFDLDVVSASISTREIINPKFHLKIKVSNEYDLPINYTVYAFAVSQSWNMGDGYWSDGGSDEGVSWTYKDNNYGSTWYNTSISGSRPAINFITDTTNSTSSFGYGGGTWYSESFCSQSFGLKSSDIEMDVTPLVMKWISGSIPNEGFILFSSDEMQSTGSGFILKFFSRDTNTIYSPCLDIAWDDSQQVTGSQYTNSIIISTLNSGITSSVQSGSLITISGGISGSFSASAILTLTQSGSDYLGNGFVVGTGLTGNITGIPVIGNVESVISISQSLVEKPCGNSLSASTVSGSFTSGIFSGSTFTAYYVNYNFIDAFLTGSWNESFLLGSSVYITLPSSIYPYAYAHVNGVYITGTALGTYIIYNTTSASFSGQFIDNNLYGASVNFQLSGSVYTSSYSYTSSIELTSSVLSPLDVSYPFTINLQNVQPQYRSGDIVRMNVFGRKKFPLKTFGKSTQQEQYLIPEYLPSSSFYALKDDQTGEIVLNFDSYTRISCDYPSGNYFIVDTTGLQQERYYRVLIQVQDNNEVYTMDTGKTFKIVRGGTV